MVEEVRTVYWAQLGLTWPRGHLASDQDTLISITQVTPCWGPGKWDEVIMGIGDQGNAGEVHKVWSGH